MANENENPIFDYITALEYRSILETDFFEMTICLNSKAWKAAMVMAGSLIEAILIEHLEWLEGPGNETRLRKYTLNEAITQCENKGEISETTAKLCSAIKDYRNLIHPGRVVRDSVPAPDQSNALIVTALVGKIAQEIAIKRSARSGLTAEQLLRKIERDSGSMAIFHHLLRQVRSQEKRRFLIDVLPSAYTERSAYTDFDYDASLLTRLSTAFRLALNDSDEHAAAVARQFYNLILNGDSTEISLYSEAFFRAPDIKHLEIDERDTVVDYLIGSVAPNQNGDDYTRTKGIGPFLKAENFQQFLTPVLRHVLSPRPSQLAKDYLAWELVSLSAELQPEAKAYLLRLAKSQDKRGNTDHAATLREYADWVDLGF